MSTQAIDVADCSFMTTDNMQIGSTAIRPAPLAAGFEQSESTLEAQADGAWATLLQGEFEEAVDSILLRATLASTLTITGRSQLLFG